ncbi:MULTISPECIES: IucA/IucC family siderophore biosynthesis protein [Halobacterium]|uniref:Iron transport protein A n=7 Tax=Halobacterium salinarum TaxID=2242 RepID=Q9HHV2_HALSA|nr:MULTISPECIES: IucA/IucC family siderophore biosynthesis protein [Halobacterium]AAG20874.1 iron transport protein A [Halobacterium salinarum NRC-1]MBB6090616.1 siderophore synthetase component [Halobacterium salinarum]MCF2207600.1 IucA/IucC family siderophore biosynthesis protein [Halobacterium salinarum]MCF2240521.1 IucA/IucC family siderophore biosynthesis protein [Halobacterium salinarum]MDL0119969.1 IucA/IucC family siderophore biosynthesis protein [Halobacterium salinarum]
MTGVGAVADTPAAHAESATLHAFLNCYLRETDAGEVVSPRAVPDGVPAGAQRADRRVVRVPFPAQSTTVFAPLRYASATGRHLFAVPAYARPGVPDAPAGTPSPIDAAGVASLARRELALDGDDPTAGRDLLERVLASQTATERFVAARDTPRDHERLYDTTVSFRDAEQSLVYGHHMHPTPNSRTGIPPHEQSRYAPELRAGFQLRVFAADPALVETWAAGDASATEWLRSVVADATTVPPESEATLVPVHPWQADYLHAQPHVAAAIARDELRDLGAFGPTFYPTSSVRTLWSPDAPFMYKGSLAVEITNAERTNKRPELARGVAVSELLATGFGDAFADRFPAFSIIEDPAAITLTLGDGAESGFEAVLRENPFAGDDTDNVTPVAALCQDGLDGPARAARIVSRIATREGRTESAVAREWFEQYLAHTVRPVVWLYFQQGVGLEAHQQNTLVRLDDDGRPTAGFYRDNQGYYFPASQAADVDDWLPGVCERADTVCPDAIADERLRYYIVFNNAFGVVNALGAGGVVDERALLAVLRTELESLAEHEPADSTLVSALLTERRVPCKANLLTRFEERDELEADLETQSVYTAIENPLVTRVDTQ